MSEEIKSINEVSFTTLDEYQELASVTDADNPLDYYFHGLSSEVGEVSAVRKRILRGDKVHGDLMSELGDCLWYIAALARHHGYSLSDIARYNIKKIYDRKNRDVIKGSGNER